MSAPDSAPEISIAREDPRTPDVAALVDDLNALMIELYRPDMCHLLDVERLAKDDVDFMVARQDGAVLGCGAIVPLDDGTCEVKRMWTAPRARGQGVARAIVHALEAQARQRSYTALRLETGVKQPEAIGLYRSEGFSERGSFAGYPESDDHLFMEKPLVAASTGNSVS